jgi:hypothetical protein
MTEAKTPPPPSVWPTLRANDAHGLIEFLTEALGFEATTRRLNTREICKIVHLIRRLLDRPYARSYIFCSVDLLPKPCQSHPVSGCGLMWMRPS